MARSKMEVMPADGVPIVVRSAIRDVSQPDGQTQGWDEASGTAALLLFVGLADDPRQIGSQMQGLLKHLPSLHKGKTHYARIRND